MPITYMRPIISQQNDLPVKLVPASFEKKDGLRLLANGFNSPEEDVLSRCFIGFVNRVPILRCGPLDTALKMQCLELTLAKVSKEKNPRYVISYMGLPSESWEKMIALYDLNTEIALLNLPTESFYYKAEDELDKEFASKSERALTQQYNIEGWLTYCRWFSESIKRHLQNLKLEQADEYRLQATMEDFIHEVNSDFLRKQQEIIRQTREQKKSAADQEQLMKIEEKWVTAHLEMQKYLNNQLEVLQKIINQIDVIENEHAELATLKEMSKMLAELLKDHFEHHLFWDKRILYFQLLNHALNVSPIITSIDGLAAVNFPFAICMAINSLLQQFPQEPFSERLYDWERACQLANEKYPQGIGAKLFPKEESKIIAFYTTLLRNRFWDYLRGFCLPIMNLSQQLSKSHVQHESWKVRLEMLSFIPYFDESFYQRMGHEERYLIHIAPASKRPSGLTKAGYQVLHRIC